MGGGPSPGAGGEPSVDHSGDRPGEEEWLTVAVAARRLGVTPRAIRSRIERGTLRWKPAGNSGKLVLIPPGAPSAEGLEDGEREADLLREELAEARVALARIEERAAALRETLERERIQHREALDREQGRADRLEAEIRELRRPWWRRLFGS